MKSGREQEERRRGEETRRGEEKRGEEEEKEDEKREEKEDEDEEDEEEATDIKSNNPHLAGGEKRDMIPCGRCSQVATVQNLMLEVMVTSPVHQVLADFVLLNIPMSMSAA